jgi:DNA-binding beta-propeller fold protein YncE
VRRAALLLAVLLLPAAVAAEGPAAVTHERAEKTVFGLKPEVALLGGFYTGAFGFAGGIHCNHRTGEMYVADSGTNTIFIFDEEGAPLFEFSDDENLNGPARVVLDDEDRILVVDGDRRKVKVFNYRGEFESYLDLPGFEKVEKPSFSALALDDNGDLYVGESTSGQVIAYDRNMKPKLKIGSYGEAPGQFIGIVGIALDAKHVYVASEDGYAVQVFTRQGRLVRYWGQHDAGLENVSLPASIAVDDRGRVILIDTLRQEIKYYDPEGRLMDLFGGLGRELGEVAYPSDISIDRKGRLCVADPGNFRVQVLKPDNVAPPSKGPPR